MNPREFDTAIQSEKIHVLHYTPERTAKKPVLLYLHGWNSRPNREVLAALCERGYESFSPTFRGHEGSDGDLSRVCPRDALEDAIAAYDEVFRHIGESRKIVLLGSSYGSYIAALLSTARNVAALSLRVPANYPDELFDQPKISGDIDTKQTMAWRNLPLTSSDNRALAAIHHFSGDVQIIESGADEQIPHQTVQNYIDALADCTRLDYQVMKGWSHSFSHESQKAKQYVDVVSAWLDRITLNS
jgi:esterase/lipase